MSDPNMDYWDSLTPEEYPEPLSDAVKGIESNSNEFPRLTSAFQHRPITGAQIRAEIERCEAINMRVRQAE